MAYNYGLPINYQVPVPYQMQYPQMQGTQMSLANQPQQTAGIIWVQGEAGAKAYPVAPGNSLLLMDSESECFYIKSTDASGVPMPLRAFTYTEIVQTQGTSETAEKIDTSQYVTRTELEELKAMVQELRNKPTYQRKEANKNA